MAADAHGRLRRAGAAAPLGGEEALDDAVLERVVGQDDEAAAGPQQVDGGGQPLGERVELLVDRDPQRLEHAGGRVDPPSLARVAGRRRVSTSCGEVLRRLDRRRLPRPRRSPWRSSRPTAPRRSGGTARRARRRRGSRAAPTPARRAWCRSACRAGRRSGSRSPRSRSASWNERQAEVEQRPVDGAEARRGRDRRRARGSSPGAGRAGRRTRPGAAATRSIAAWSASSPRTRPSGLAASRIRSVCPPPPTVASIWRLPGAGASVPRTSSGMHRQVP